jgi:hypothetical protein
MNNSDLEAKLRSVPVPARTKEYWDDFPVRVRVQLHRRSPEASGRAAGPARFAWATSIAFSVTLILICAQHNPLRAASAAWEERQQGWEMKLARLDAGLHRLMLNTDGMGYLLADPN